MTRTDETIYRAAKLYRAFEGATTDTAKLKRIAAAAVKRHADCPSYDGLFHANGGYKGEADVRRGHITIGEIERIAKLPKRERNDAVNAIFYAKTTDCGPASAALAA